jgi:hypothetical protein
VPEAADIRLDGALAELIALRVELVTLMPPAAVNGAEFAIPQDTS